MSLKGERGARDFNKRFPVGTPVRYYHIRGVDEFVETVTRSEAWPLGHGAVVVKIMGKTGGVLIDHVFALPTERGPKT